MLEISTSRSFDSGWATNSLRDRIDHFKYGQGWDRQHPIDQAGFPSSLEPIIWLSSFGVGNLREGEYWVGLSTKNRNGSNKTIPLPSLDFPFPNRP